MREQKTEQVLYTNVMKVGKQPYLNTLIEPLQLFVQTGVARETANNLGKVLQGQLDLVRLRSFKPKRVHTDPQTSFKAIVRSFPKVKVDISGTCNNIDKVDI